MALYVKDLQVALLAEQLAVLRKTSKTEAVRQALQHELERERNSPSLVELGLAFGRKVRALGDPKKSQPVDKNFIDSLYEDD